MTQILRKALDDSYNDLLKQNAEDEKLVGYLKEAEAFIDNETSTYGSGGSAWELLELYRKIVIYTEGIKGIAGICAKRREEVNLMITARAIIIDAFSIICGEEKAWTG